MLQELSVYNYKAFVESTVPIRPITILLGANSVGKSSIIQLLLGLSQTAEEDTHSYKSALKIYGSSVNFGSIENIFHGKKTNLTLGIDITINDNGGMSFLQEIITDLKKEIEYCLNVVPLVGLQRMRDSKISNKAEILDVLTKIKNVMRKVVPDTPHEVLLVLDGSTGQNAYEQAKQFVKATDVTALAITKLDGTAKGGVVIGISHQLGVPVKYIGLGEKMTDLQPFKSRDFVDALFSMDDIQK